MKKWLQSAAWAIVFVWLLLCAVWTVNRTLMPKYGYQNTNPLTETYKGFYRMEPNTIDVLFLGSSHTGSAFNPQELYNDYGIRSYNLGNNSQPLWISYYWLLEALKYQTPQVVVLDTYCLYINGKKNESAARVPLDSMRFGAVKREAVKTVCDMDNSQSALSYFFPNIRFHTRWTGLNENDFLRGENPTPQSKGFWLYRNRCGDEEYAPFSTDEAAGEEEFLPEPGEYLDKITTLCKERGIQLILVKTPTHAQTTKRHNTVSAYAEKHDLLFYDFNEIS